jgi:hypothetical protein
MPFSWTGKNVCVFASAQMVDLVSVLSNGCVRIKYFPWCQTYGIASFSTGSTAHCGPWPPAPTAFNPDKIGSGSTYKCDLPVHHLTVGSDWLSEAAL